MHLVVPFAGLPSPAAAQAAGPLDDLPRLARLLALLAPSQADEGEADALSPPHERALAGAWGWPLVDGLLPFAAEAARRDGLAPADDGRGWALLSPTHWLAGTDGVSLGDPDGLALDEAEARALFATLAPLFDDAGGERVELLWGAPTRWYAVHTSFAGLPTASLDRVVGRSIEAWLRTHPEARRIRRLQAEAQMLLHGHPVNEAREGRGLPPANSFWLSGTGRPLAVPADGPTVDARLRGPALAEDWPAWAEAWRALDAGPLAALLADAEAGRPASLTLCGERHARRFDTAPRGLMTRLFGARRAPVLPVLETL